MTDDTATGREDEIDRDVGGVQGTEGDDTTADATGDAGGTDEGTTVIAPDAGEIEWAGGLVKKAPGTSNP
ncbi:hypothetical protein [Sphingomonas sp. NFR15]|uniref:hypothetical protein n=1 Tax=Sphingomonas sp. NFR15 TaxID=1566282 RepID=UPI00087EA448|nr:hypothetical protein [Sphingomonas sp. NFR15]SDA16625.1 hypothetical protein SAMN03159340_00947 [Sphingomonas sp. NFR15]